MEQIFYETLEREGIEIRINNRQEKVFFRKNNSGESDSYTTVFAPVTALISQGDTFTFKGVNYLIIKQLTTENDVYNKYTAVRCNQTIKYELRKVNNSDKADLTMFSVFMVDISDRQRTGEIITLSSQAEFKLSLNELSKRIHINERFYCGSYHSPWKINEMNYKDNMVSLYCERDVASPNDDKENGIADRWTFEPKPKSYEVIIVEDSLTIDVDSLSQLTVSVKENGTSMENLPLIHWDSSDISIAYVNENNQVVGVAEGNCIITGSYKQSEYDICVSDSVQIMVNSAIVVGDIIIQPVYNENDYYDVGQYTDQLFTASITGVATPSWNITLNPQTVPSKNYVSTIDNAKGTFHLENKISNKVMLIYTVTETTSGKTVDYTIKLGSMF